MERTTSDGTHAVLHGPVSSVAPKLGSRAAGASTPKDAYDMAELEINRFLLRRKPAFSTAIEAPAAVALCKYMEQIVGMMPSQTRRTEETERFQQFSTPIHYGFVAAWVASPRPDDVAMEPSAGIGGLAVHLLNSGVKQVIVNELSDRRRMLLRTLTDDARFGPVLGLDGEQLNNLLPTDVRPTLILMNPPFSAAGSRMGDKRFGFAGAMHVEQALLRLRPGGRLVTILSQGMGPDRATFAPWWAKIKGKYTVRANIGIPGDVYKKYGTTIGTRLVVIDKVNLPAYESQNSDCETLEQAIALLDPIRLARPEIMADAPKPAPIPAVKPAATPASRPASSVVWKQPELPSKPAAEVPKPQTAKSVIPTPPPAPTPVHVEAKSETDDNAEITDAIFEPYKPQRLKIPGAQPHPTDLVQSAAMASVLPPEPTYFPNLPPDLITSGTLSEAQLEAVVYTGQSHQKFLPPEFIDGKDVIFRRGMFLGDATGVGKGREITAIILDSFRNGEHKALWVSKSRKLIHDARRDWGDIGGNPDDIFGLHEYKANDRIVRESGICFLTYSTLRGRAKSAEGAVRDINGVRLEPGTRLKQLFDWLGPDFNGVIGFDESHAMKNSAVVEKQ